MHLGTFVLAAMTGFGGLAASPPVALGADEKPAQADQAAAKPTENKAGWRVVGDSIRVDTADGTLTTNGMFEYRVAAHQLDAPQRGAFLGLSTSPPDPVLQKQLQLKPGVGLVVDGVEAGSPAEQAGVKQYDLLHKLDDQLLINAEQLAVLIRSYEPGKEVKLTVIREGKPQTLPAKLVERELPPLRWYFRSNTAELAQPLNIVTKDLREFSVDSGTFVFSTPIDQAPAAAQITIEDAERKMTVTRPGGRRHLKVQDKAGKTLFEGPIETKEELETVPAEIRDAYQEIMKSAAPAGASAATDVEGKK